MSYSYALYAVRSLHVKYYPYAILLICCLHAFATSVVVLRNRGVVVLAADSKGTTLRGTNTAYDVECKINLANGIYFATAGLDADSAGFDAHDLAAESLRSSRTMKGAAEKFARITSPGVLRALQTLRKVAPKAYKETSQGHDSLDAVFVGIEHAAPTIVFIQFVRKENSAGFPINIVPKIKACPGGACPGSDESGYSWFLGESDAAEQAANAAGFWTDTGATDARRLIQIEIKDVPHKVGPPIDVLAFSAFTGHDWIPPRGACTDEEYKPRHGVKSPKAH